MFSAIARALSLSVLTLITACSGGHPAPSPQGPSVASARSVAPTEVALWPAALPGPASHPAPQEVSLTPATPTSRSEPSCAELDHRLKDLELRLSALRLDAQNNLVIGPPHPSCVAGAPGCDVVFQGVNVRITNGAGATPTVNGEGNLIVGYDEEGALYTQGGTDQKSGSHNVVVGRLHSYPGHSGLVAGVDHLVSGPGAVALGGAANAALTDYAVVVGGEHNVASGRSASVVGGSANLATGIASSTVGGLANQAHGWGATTSGGEDNLATGDLSAAVGGSSNLAAGVYAVVAGGGAWGASEGNAALGDASVVLGGGGATADPAMSVITGTPDGVCPATPNPEEDEI